MQPNAHRGIGFALAVFILLAAAARAGTTPAAPPNIPIPVYTPGPVSFQPGDQLNYQVTWEGLPVAIAQVRIEADRKHPDVWRGEVHLSTNKLVDIVYQLRADLSDEFAPATLVSQAVQIKQRENRRDTQYSIDFHRARGIVESIRRTHKHTEIHRYRARYPVGPVSGALLALSQPLAVGNRLTFDTFVGSNRYVLAFDVTGREQLALSAGTTPVLRVVPNLLYISAPRDHYRVSRAVVYLADDSYHTPLRIVADTFVGRFYIDLVGGSPEGGGRVAGQ